MGTAQTTIRERFKECSPSSLTQPRAQRLNFMYCWLCISIHLCNKSQLDAIFILSLFRQSTSTCFGHICSPSSGDILYVYSNWYVLCFSVDWFRTMQHTHW